jgi:hypothetical protein
MTPLIYQKKSQLRRASQCLAAEASCFCLFISFSLSPFFTLLLIACVCSCVPTSSLFSSHGICPPHICTRTRAYTQNQVSRGRLLHTITRDNGGTSLTSLVRAHAHTLSFSLRDCRLEPYHLPAHHQNTSTRSGGRLPCRGHRPRYAGERPPTGACTAPWFPMRGARPMDGRRTRPSVMWYRPRAPA